MLGDFTLFDMVFTRKMIKKSWFFLSLGSFGLWPVSNAV